MSHVGLNGATTTNESLASAGSADLSQLYTLSSGYRVDDSDLWVDRTSTRWEQLPLKQLSLDPYIG